MQPTELINAITLPQQTLGKLSFCGGNKPQKVEAWISQLRVTQTMPTAILLYRCVPEINQLKCDARTRFEILELIRPIVHNIINGLTKDFLNQPIALPEEAKRTALIAQALQKNLIDGYLLCLKEVISKQQVISKNSDFFNQALHRAITGIGNFFLRNYQLYVGTPPGLWVQLHSLFLVGDYYHILECIVEDPVSSSHIKTTIKAAYLRVLMLASCRPNQLSQKDLAAVFKIAEKWSPLIKYHRNLTGDKDNFFCVDLSADDPPGTKSSVYAEKEAILELDFKALIHELEHGHNGTKLSEGLQKTLLSHVVDCWSNVPERMHERRRVKGAADICIGLRDLHQAVSNHVDLDALIESSIHGASDADVSVQGITPNNRASVINEQLDIPLYQVSIQNISRNGYCVLWRGEVSAKLNSGEVVGIRDKGRNTWGVGVIRWIRQYKQGAQLGIQILSDRPLSYGAAQIYDMGGHSDFSRALYLPASRFNDMQATLITATTPFQAAQNIKIVDGEKEQTWSLQKSLFATRSLQQFTFLNVD